MEIDGDTTRRTETKRLRWSRAFLPVASPPIRKAGHFPRAN
jgi:hypothetical protein